MSKFSLRNGLKITRHHMRDPSMWFGFIAIAILPAIAMIFPEKHWPLIVPVTWVFLFIIIIILVRCWDDPVELGYEEKKNE
jgi:hypothetical protein